MQGSDSPTTIQPIYRRAASTKARVRSVSLGARAEGSKNGKSSQWFLPVDGMMHEGGDAINVSPQEWVDEWCALRLEPTVATCGVFGRRHSPPRICISRHAPFSPIPFTPCPTHPPLTRPLLRPL